MESGRYGRPRPGTPAPVFANAFEGFADEGSHNLLVSETHRGANYIEGFGVDSQLHPWEFSFDVEQHDNQSSLNWNNASAPGLPMSTEQQNPLYGANGYASTGLQVGDDDNFFDWTFETDNFASAQEDFLQYIEGAFRPPVACSYCRYHRLQCLTLKTTFANPNPVTACSSCVALFRECSLAIGEKRKASEFETNDPIMGHLHGVNEEYEDGGDFLNWQDTTESSVSPVISTVSRVREESSPTTAAAKAKRTISKQDIRVLKAWVSEHRHSPYPSEQEKLELRATTGLTVLQISNWFANARRRQRQIQSIPIPPRGPGSKPKMMTQEPMDLSPIARWKNSPPEEDSIDPSVVAQAIASTSSTNNYQDLWIETPGSDDRFNLAHHQPTSFDTRSVSSRETSQSGLSSDSSTSVWSHGSYASHHSYSSITRPKRRRHQKRTQLERRANNQTASATYHCTFCPDSFKKRHDWQRHEKSIHLPLERWICSSGDGTVVFPDSTSAQCLFCGILDPPRAHLNAHEFNSCSERPVLERTFRRKDHLRQHLVKFHGCPKPMDCVMNLWKVEWGEIRSRCGFCDMRFCVWEARAAHLAGHFKDGAKREEWAGDWGLDDDVFALLQNAVLPGVDFPGRDVELDVT